MTKIISRNIPKKQKIKNEKQKIKKNKKQKIKNKKQIKIIRILPKKTKQNKGLVV